MSIPPEFSKIYCECAQTEVSERPNPIYIRPVYLSAVRCPMLDRMCIIVHNDSFLKSAVIISLPVARVPCLQGSPHFLILPCVPTCSRLRLRDARRFSQLSRGTPAGDFLDSKTLVEVVKSAAKNVLCSVQSIDDGATALPPSHFCDSRIGAISNFRLIQGVKMASRRLRLQVCSSLDVG